MKTKRTHDLLYLDENRYETPKEIFLRGAEIAHNAGMLDSGKTIVDIGCAAGEFLYHLTKVYPGPNYIGIDVLDKLLEKAGKMVPGVEFRRGSVFHNDLLPSDSADGILMYGVHGLVDDLREVLARLVGWTKPGGNILIFGSFNKHPVDVWVQYKLSGDGTDDAHEIGWNQFSLESVKRWVEDVAPGATCTVEKFELSFDDPPKPDDIMRSWTFRDEHGEKAFTNGLSLILNRYFVLIELPQGDV